MSTDRNEEDGQSDETGALSGFNSPWLDIRVTLGAGAVVAAALFIAVFSVGEATNGEARVLLESTLPTIRFLASSILTVGATVLALMLTLLGFIHSIEYTLSSTVYRRVRMISLMNVVAIISAVGLLLFIGLPIQESETLRSMYEWLYYSVLVVASLLGGLTVAMVLLLHRTIYGLTGALGPWDDPQGLIEDEEEPESEGKKARSEDNTAEPQGDEAWDPDVLEKRARS